MAYHFFSTKKNDVTILWDADETDSNYFSVFCHFDEGEIFASNSATNVQSLSSLLWRFLLRRNDNDCGYFCINYNLSNHPLRFIFIF